MKFDYLTPIYSLFSFYLQTNKKEEAINTCVAAQSASKMIVITPICKQIRKKADTKLASDVVDILKAHPNVTSSKILGFAYSAWIDVVCKWKNSLRKLDQIYDFFFLKRRGEITTILLIDVLLLFIMKNISFQARGRWSTKSVHCLKNL